MVRLHGYSIKPRGSLVNRDELRLTFVGLRLIHPPRPRFTGTTLHDLYAAMCKRHSFESFEVHGDTGATFSSEGIRDLHIERDRLRVEEEVSVSFDLLKRNFTDMVKLVQEDLNIPAFVEPRIKLRALWPLPQDGPNAVTVLRDQALKLNQDQYDLLNVESLEGVGIVINADLAEHSHLYLDVTPYYRDDSQLSIDLECYSHASLETPEVIESRLQEFYDYFSTKVTAFIETFMP